MVRRGKGVISNKSYLRVEGRGGKEGDGETYFEWGRGLQVSARGANL